MKFRQVRETVCSGWDPATYSRHAETVEASELSESFVEALQSELSESEPRAGLESTLGSEVEVELSLMVPSTTVGFSEARGEATVSIGDPPLVIVVVEAEDGKFGFTVHGYNRDGQRFHEVDAEFARDKKAQAIHWLVGVVGPLVVEEPVH